MATALNAAIEAGYTARLSRRGKPTGCTVVWDRDNYAVRWWLLDREGCEVANGAETLVASTIAAAAALDAYDELVGE